MLLLAENATAQPSFHHLGLLRTQNQFHNTLASISFTLSNEHRIPLAWKAFEKLKKVNFNVGFVKLRRGTLLIKAVSTLEPKCLVANEGRCIDSKNKEPGNNSIVLDVQLESSIEESTEINDREKLRRMRISKANKGITPWNKGRKHSAETLQRIRERTRLAMQDPKVKMKLVKFGHSQSKETRVKIGIGVRMGWERRRGKQMVQESCYFEWQNLIAEASRQGYIDEEELQWSSYKILDEQFKKEWLESVKQWQTMLRTPVNQRAPKSAERGGKFQKPSLQNGLILITVSECALPCTSTMGHQLELKGNRGEGQVMVHSPQEVAQQRKRKVLILLLGVRLKFKMIFCD
ncbi:Muscle M-line assembly protein unc-89, putative isoform 2 [Quillaja saponaria]|uniref:Muscle M-line assembly protein unc-89, putative isoform 2 n=1 Tax=Quillaja saponaria TaxID=32244 RepID=A0AAD7LS77_QUISA|nr:Muscle M-line assembly protein unc-89, putative isoform 2 [Quillaja saponaria]